MGAVLKLHTYQLLVMHVLVRLGGGFTRWNLTKLHCAFLRHTRLLNRTLDNLREGAKLLVPNKSDTQIKKCSIKERKGEKFLPISFFQNDSRMVKKRKEFDRWLRGKPGRKRSTCKFVGWTTKVLLTELKSIVFHNGERGKQKCKSILRKTTKW